MTQVPFTLVVPNTRYRQDYLWSVLPSRGLLSLAAALRQAGHPVAVVDADLASLSPDQVSARAKAAGSRVVGITMNTFQSHAGLAVARAVKTADPGITVVAGGPHPSADPEDVLREPAVDAACLGEGEATVVALAEAVASGAPLDGVAGLAVRDGGRVRKTAPRPGVPDLDALPFPAYDLAGDLRRYPGAHPVRQPPSMHLMASRGCPFHCTFCSDAVFGKHVRFMSPARVADEVDLLHRDFGVREIFFQDDTMNLKRVWFEAVCDALIARGLPGKVVFKTQFRVNRALLDEALLARAKAAGCWAVFYGVESGSQEVLDLMRKGTTLDEIRRAFDLTRRAGLTTIASFMVGNAGDTARTVADTVRLCQEIDPDEFGFAVATPLPGTAFHRLARERGWIEIEDLREYSEFIPVARNEALTRVEIRALRDWADRTARASRDMRRKEQTVTDHPTAPVAPRAAAPAAPPPEDAGVKAFFRGVPVLGPLARYLFWWAMLPHRVNRIHDYLRDIARSMDRMGRSPGGAAPPPPAAPPGVPDSAAWAGVDWTKLPPEQVKALMDQRFAAGEAYGRVHLWDEVRNAELTDTFRDALLRGRDPLQTAILDIGCGLGGLAEQVKQCREFVGVDLSEVAVHDAIRRYGHRPGYRFLQMDATKLDFPDNHFDVVAAREVLEHLPEPSRCVAEAFRVLKPGGSIVASSPTRDSLHLRVNRLLGHPDFKCSYDHIREFTTAELRGLLMKAGFRIRDEAGVFLMPYWGIPAVDDPVRRLTDDHPVLLEDLRQLGRRAGAEYAFIAVIAAEKPAE
jgi:radical SAM superfamily enzyme YgiQ (UPF0313 family)/2-polyprenyl-3-methyl-5-hydroxy-6-metoxy-1,4-benzoquinol methylase